MYPILIFIALKGFIIDINGGGGGGRSEITELSHFIVTNFN